MGRERGTYNLVSPWEVHSLRYSITSVAKTIEYNGIAANVATTGSY